MKLSPRLLVPLALVALAVAGCGVSYRPTLSARRMAELHLVGPLVPHDPYLVSRRSTGAGRAKRTRGQWDRHRFEPRVSPHRLIIERLDIPRDPALAPSERLLAVSREILSVTIAGQHVVIVIPQHSLHRAILFEHGSGESADLDIDIPPSSRAITRLVRAGYTWAESDAGFNNWGDAASLRDDMAVAQWLRDHGDPTIDIGGDSMGGLDATQLIPLVHPDAVFELFPVCDEATVTGEFGTLMRQADAPLARLSPVAMDDVRGLPMLFTASPQDTVVSKATNADVCAREARAAGARVDNVTTVGEHDNRSNWKPSRLITFLNAASARSPRGSGRVGRVGRRTWRPRTQPDGTPGPAAAPALGDRRVRHA